MKKPKPIKLESVFSTNTHTISNPWDQYLWLGDNKGVVGVIDSKRDIKRLRDWCDRILKEKK